MTSTPGKLNRTSDPGLTEDRLDAALHMENDSILPSSGFADSVMAAVSAEAGVPAPIPFPWKRVLPGLIVASAATLALIVGLIPALLRTLAAARASSAGGSGVHGAAGRVFGLVPLLHSVAVPDAAWITLALAIPLLCLILMRRLLFSR
jgi:hypothetical protein